MVSSGARAALRRSGAVAGDAAPRPGSEAAGSPEPSRRVAVGVLVGLVLAKATYYAVLGPALILDDWRLINNTQVYGVMHTLHGGGDSVSRPVAWLWFNLVYALAGSSPMRLLVVVTLLNVAIVVLLYLLLARYLPPALGFWVAAVWVVLPIHTALSVWGGVVQALLSIVLFLLGLLALSHARWVPAAACIAAAALCYQVAIPLAGLAIVALPVDDDTFGWRDRAKVLVAVAAASLWVALHPTYPTSFHVPDVASLWRAHFGTGLFASADPPAPLRTALAVAVLCGVVLSVVAWLRGRREWSQGPSLVLLGMVVWVGGLLVLVSTPQWVQAGEFGLTDRVFGLSSLGAAMVFVGLGRWLWNLSPPAAVVVGVGFGAVCLIGQHVALQSWSEAGDDARAVLDHLERVAQYPNRETFLVGPDYPGRNNVISLENDAAYFAHKMRYPPGNEGTLSFFFDVFQQQVPGQILVPWSTIDHDFPDEFYAGIAQIEAAESGSDGVRVAGWALDRSTSAPVPVEVYLDGSATPDLTIPAASLPRPDVATAYGVGPDHGYDAVVPTGELARGQHEACVLPITRHDGRRVTPDVPQCLAFSVGSDVDGGPVGRLDAVVATPAGLQVTGWAIDPTTSEPVAVEVVVDGADEPYGRIDPADVERPDLLDVYELGSAHGFDQVLPGPPLTVGEHEVCLWIEPVDPSGDLAQATCTTVQVDGP